MNDVIVWKQNPDGTFSADFWLDKKTKRMALKLCRVRGITLGDLLETALLEHMKGNGVTV